MIVHSDNIQNWMVWRDKLFCDLLLFSTTKIALNANSLIFPWLFTIFIFSLTFNKIPWLLPSLEFPWLFPDRWTPCRCYDINQSYRLWKQRTNKCLFYLYCTCNTKKFAHHFPDWSIKSLFGRTLGSSCPLATDSKIYVDLTENKVSYT